MTISIGAFTFAAADEPDDGDFSYGVPLRTSQFNPEGYDGTIVTYHSKPGNKHRVHAYLGETAMTALQAIAAARAEVVLTNTDRPGLAGGVNVAIIEFTADHNSKAPGRGSDGYWYDVWIGMVETGT